MIDWAGDVSDQGPGGGGAISTGDIEETLTGALDRPSGGMVVGNFPSPVAGDNSTHPV